MAGFLGFELLWAPQRLPPLKPCEGPCFWRALLLVGPYFWWDPTLGGPLLLVGPYSWWTPTLGGTLLFVDPYSWWNPTLGGLLLLVGPTLGLVSPMGNAALIANILITKHWEINQIGMCVFHNHQPKNRF